MRLGLFRKDERGSVMIVISFIIMMISVLGMVYSMTTLSTHKLTVSYRDGDMANAAAMAGVEHGLHKLAYMPAGTPVDFAEELTLANGQTIKVNSRSGTATVIINGVPMATVALLESEATVRGVTKGVRVTIFNDSKEIHELYYKAIFAANSHGIPYTLEFTGKDNDADDIRGDAHNNGDIEFSLNAFSTWNWGNNKCTATGVVQRVDEIGIPNLIKGGGDSYINAPDLKSMGYENAARRYKEWDPGSQGATNDIVDVGEAYAHYSANLQTIAIAREGGYFGAGGYYEWNSSAKALPDGAAANFFQYDYQNHYVKSYTSTEDTKIDQTKNYYIGARNGGTSGSYGNIYGLYGGGHAVIKISQQQNNKIYYVDGNLWFDSDGCNHVFFVPDAGVDKLNITIVVKGNIYIGDQIWTIPDDKQKNIGGSYNCQAFNMLDPDSGIALIAMNDGETYDDVNKNGKYDNGETIIGRTDPNTPIPAANNPASGAGVQYRGRMEGSGNVVFGDTIDGPIGVVHAFLYAENNFVDITSSGSDQTAFTRGNMTAGNRVYLSRNYTDWQSVKNMGSAPAGWINIGGSYYPPGTNPADVNNPFVVVRRWYNGKIYARRHNPLQVTLDDRIVDGTIKLPGLPHSTDIQNGTWTPVAMQVVDGKILPDSWVPD